MSAIILLLITATLVNTDFARIAFAQFTDPQGSPCPEGQIPETDSFGQIILDPTTGDPNCIIGPS